MIIRPGEKYKFEYFPIKIYTNIHSKECVEKKVYLSAFVPIDFTEWSPDGFVLIEIHYDFISNDPFSRVNPIILYFDEIKVKGSINGRK